MAASGTSPGLPIRQTSPAPSILSIDDKWFFYDISVEEVHNIFRNTAYDTCYLVTGASSAATSTTYKSAISATSTTGYKVLQDTSITEYTLHVKHDITDYSRFYIERTNRNRYLLDRTVSTTEYSDIASAVKFLLEIKFPGIPPVFDAEEIIDATDNKFTLSDLPSYNQVQKYPTVHKDLPRVYLRTPEEYVEATDIILSTNIFGEYLRRRRTRPVSGQARRDNLFIRLISLKDRSANRFNPKEYGLLRLLTFILFYISTLCIILPVLSIFILLSPIIIPSAIIAIILVVYFLHYLSEYDD